MSRTTSEKPMGVVLLPYQNFTSKYISRLLAKHYIKPTPIPMKKSPSTLRPIKDDMWSDNKVRELIALKCYIPHC